jgi:hypothetical protein
MARHFRHRLGRRGRRLSTTERMHKRAGSLPRLHISRFNDGSGRVQSVAAGDHKQTITQLGDRRLPQGNNNSGRIV